MKISVIVPVYNAERYIGPCIESILAQSHTDLECLLVDDGSKDSSGYICDEYAAKDGRVKVIHQENGGEIAARSAGIRTAQGDYLYFVDADDKIAPDALSCMLHYANVETDIVVFESKQDIVYSMPDYAKALLGFNHWTVWGKLYKRCLFDEYVMDIPRYFKVGEDFLTNLKTLKNIKGKIICKPISKYLYNITNPGSIQLSHKHSYEYEVRMVYEVKRTLSCLTGKNDLIRTALLKWELVYLGGMIGLQYPIDYSDDWIVELQQACKDMKLSVREQIIIAAINRKAFRYPLIIEKKVKNAGRKFLRRIL